ncbi:tRNA dihydrouridine synthase DusB [Methylovirgula sp. HY1]|uniref:tRNA dihydrouridine synthase DusB n=1 Tax=Methylovirgula sp. HY1 TaxID=2822761 RepID=UPI00351CC59C
MRDCGAAASDYNLDMNFNAQPLSNFSGGLIVGSLHLTGRAFLAPMAGVSDFGMRRLAMSFGAALTVSEMLDAEFYVGGDREAVIRAAGEGITPHIVQIAGCAAGPLAEAARLAEAAGAAMIDINMGCPAKRVTGGAAGSALMRDLDLATDLIRAVVGAVQVPVSLKMRLGWDEAAFNAPELARRAECEGVAMLTVHGRTRNQFYRGKADWAAIRKVREAVSVPLVANGDCTSARDAAAMLEASGADAVMIGRAAIGRPWLVGQIAAHLAQGAMADGSALREPSAASRQEAAVDHYRTLLSLFGKAKGLRHARKHLAAYTAGSTRADAGALRARLVTSENPTEVEALLATLLEAEPVAGNA